VRKPIVFSLVALVLILGGVAGTMYAKYRRASADFTEMKTAEAAAQTRYTETIDAIAGIQDSLNAIVVTDPSVPLISKDLATEQQVGQTGSQAAMDRIAMLRAVVLRSKERIETLETNLAKSGKKVGSLQRLVANLKQTVIEKEQVVDQLSLRVDSLNTQVAGLSTEVQQGQETIRAREQTIEEKRTELATMYVAVGSKKELKEKGVIISKGGLLGMGKTILPSPNASMDSFQTIDTDQETVIRTASKEAKVVTPQSVNSYELRMDEQGHIELHIIDPREFRKVRQLVIVTA